MNNDIKEHFFSRENIALTFENVRTNIKHKCDYDINHSKTIKNSFIKYAESVYNGLSDAEKNLTNLNSSLVERCTSYYIKAINNKLIKNEQLDKNIFNSMFKNLDKDIYFLNSNIYFFELT